MRISGRRSFSVTSAARVRRPVVTPVAISDQLRTEQGATIIPWVLKVPDAIGAPISPGAYAWAALAATAFGFRSVSSAMVSSAALVTTRWDSTFSSASASSSLIP